MTTATIERRASAEVRAAGRKLTGYAAIFGQEARIGSFTESVLPGAFRSSLLSGADILGLADHDPTKVLGRTRSGTLHLEEDAKGLAFTIDLPETNLGRDVLEMVKRGDVGGMSIGFVATEEAWPSKNRRILHSIDLREISIVSAFPAYDGTSIAARSRPCQTLRRRYVRLALNLG